MFDIGFSELLIIFVIGLLVLGPERLPHAARTLGLWLRKIRRSVDSVQREINAQLDQEELQRKIEATNKQALQEEQNTQQDDAPSAEVMTEKAQPIAENTAPDNNDLVTTEKDTVKAPQI
ncbi:Sec-independent protein translocase protein TatB [Marinomonas sp. C2222]|uniref:Sec-independent protein translocase protein TatB n=1 Tax=Marinomonas sargassi TaxID=2984494 RepID=A0ABT2YP77_9GAMM|nr:Sec-independent protein translocase protein TatB [Marinomonas sargassi]MCV2401685.1 Sec-independent protein translocase protein TatB [Marinomonas sargassi]